jgi:phosphatidate cytidylyltransferase
VKKILQRILVFVICLPLIFALVYLLPQRGQLAFNIAVLVFSVLGTLEFAMMIAKKGLMIKQAEALVLGALGPAATTAVVSFNLDYHIVPAAFIAGVSWVLVSGIVLRAGALESFINRLCAGFAVMIYPGLFIEWIIRMGSFEQSSVIILVFIALVFGNDSLAWLAGMLFGKGNKGIIPASPNKSIAGFAGGIAASLIVGIGAALLFPAVFVPRGLSAPAAGALLGLLPGIAASLGDLGESAIKRSSATKDSGGIIPGRGGVLDSIDSVALAAPVFYGAMRLFFIQP